MRDDDSYVGLYERAYIANDLNASLFLCVHNNAYDSSAHGTETLYTPNSTTSFSSYRFAQIIQEEMVNTLGTYDRGLDSRPGLVVLKATKMPAALAEVAFITNTADRNKLISNAFKQKAAEALCESVIRALGEL
jgi:N-acetylmuramoyl-L-alanine amidase